MSVFTGYFCGTGSTRLDVDNTNYWSGELVSTLAANDLCPEFTYAVAMDGPGSGNLQDDELFVEPGRYSAVMGTLFGRGWNQNVAHAMQVIKGRSSWQRDELSKVEYNRLKAAGVPIPDAAHKFLGQRNFGQRKVTSQALREQIIAMSRPARLPTRVNLVGWSRGGISCHMLANAMAADPELKHIPVNIFALDPVPGIGNMQSCRITLERNVQEYVGFYSRDERSKGFAPVIPKTAPSTVMYIYPIPGRHATLVGNASRDGKSSGQVLAEPGLIVRHTAETFLTRWGTKLANRLNLSDRQLMTYQKLMQLEDNLYQAMSKQSYTVLREGIKGERSVHYGASTKPFSELLDDRLPLGMPWNRRG
ncbi:hypothetical protein ACIQUF_10250 [Pseudomonas sp. NPDC090233]|uniref:hypothetical protein n=1 Tax=Pseudomonas sp. NPDC090233 TaxID=3364479 RepID=UPI00383BB5AC